MRNPELVLVQDAARVRTLTLNRPAALNAFNDALYDAAGDALRDAAADPAVAVVIITGAGRAFTAGQDLGEMADPPRHSDGEPHGFAYFLDVLCEFPKPLIAAVNGLGVGIGLTLLPHCDFVLISEAARLRAPFATLGVTVEAGNSLLLPERIGWTNAAHLLYTAEWLDADACVALGLAWKKVPADELLTAAHALARPIAAMPISSLVAEDYAAANPEFEYSVDGPGTGDGFVLFCRGETDISNASRPISDEEVAACDEGGVEYVELKVAIDGISVLTSPANDAVECLSFLDLYALMGPEGDGYGTWSDQDAVADELAAELSDEFGASNAPYPDAPLRVTAPGEESGTYDSFLELVFEDIAEARGTDPVARPGYTASADDNVIVEGISGSDTSLGWVGYAFAVNNSDVIMPIPIDGGDGCVAPTDETISDGSYPIARSLYIYPSLTSLEENTALEAFVDFYMSDEGFASVTEVGYVSLPEERIEATRPAWEEKRAGKFTD